MKPAEYARMHAAEQRQWWYAGMRSISLALLDGALPRDKKHRLLDAGCGTGGNLGPLRRYGWVAGLDLADEALRLAREQGAPVVRSDLSTLPFMDASLDCITSFDVLYHRWIPDDHAAVREVVRVLRPGGWFFLRVPALRLLRGAHDEEVLTRHRYTRAEVEVLLSDCGLNLQRSSYCNFLLLPLLVLRRLLDRLLGRRGSDVAFLPTALEALFRRALELEAFWLARHALPIGSSVIALARKPETPRSGSGPGRINGRMESENGGRS
jgi:SAM-dependent methyltransferase